MVEQPHVSLTDQQPFTEAQRHAWERLVIALRQAITHAVQLDAPVATFDALTQQLEAVVAALAPFSGTKPVPRFRVPFDVVSPDDCLPYSPISGKLNPLAPPVSFKFENERMVARVTLGPAYEGAVGFAHGGVVAMIWDQVLALANVAVGAAGPTGELRIRYVAPTPVGQELRFEAWHERRDGRKILALGRGYVGDTLLTEAEGLFIALDHTKTASTGWGRETQSAGSRPARRPAGDPTS